MPRAAIIGSKRGKRDRDTRPLARTAASVRAAALAAQQQQQESRSAPGPVPAKLENSLARIPPAAASVSPSKAGWRHPDELPYIRSAGKAREWDDLAIVRFLRARAFSVHARPASTQDPFISVRTGDGAEVSLPRGYRLPLMWLAKYQWTSVRLVLTAHAGIRQKEWDAAKWEILHIARLCATLLDRARTPMDKVGALELGWRCAPFDRALRRYYNDWLIMRDEFVRDFWREFGEEEYAGDVLKLPWARWVLKGHKGFVLTNEDVANGISAVQFIGGLVVDEERETFKWCEELSDKASAAIANPEDFIEPRLTRTIPAAVEVPAAERLVPQQKPVVRIPLPGEGRRVSVRTVKIEQPTPVEILSSSPDKPTYTNMDVKMTQMRTAYPSLPGETPTHPTPTPPSHQTPILISSASMRGVAPPMPITSTTMGSVAPGRGRGAKIPRKPISPPLLGRTTPSSPGAAAHSNDGDVAMQDAPMRESPLHMNMSSPWGVPFESTSALAVNGGGRTGADLCMLIDIDAEDPDLNFQLGYPDEEDAPQPAAASVSVSVGAGAERGAYPASDESEEKDSEYENDEEEPLPSLRLSAARFPGFPLSSTAMSTPRDPASVAQLHPNATGTNMPLCMTRAVAPISAKPIPPPISTLSNNPGPNPSSSLRSTSLDPPASTSTNALIPTFANGVTATPAPVHIPAHSARSNPTDTSSALVLAHATAAVDVVPLFTDPALVQRFKHAWDALRAEVRELRAEVGVLRARVAASQSSPSPSTSANSSNSISNSADAHPYVQEKAPLPMPMSASSSFSSISSNNKVSEQVYDGASAGWGHPLQHLLSFAEDGDVAIKIHAAEQPSAAPAAPLPPSIGFGVPYRAGSSNGIEWSASSGSGHSEPLPPRSRKFRV